MSQETTDLSDEEQQRLHFNVGSACSIYSRSKQKWFVGRIVDLYVHQQTNQEWLIVKYGNTKKEIQRFSTALRPIQTILNVDKDFPHKTNVKEILNYFSAFQSTDSTITCKSIDDGCASTERMIYALKYYSLLNVMDGNNNSNENQKFIKFVNDIYKFLLEDYIHITDKHNNDLDNIYKLMNEKYNFRPCS
eukprot:176182_1